MDISRHRYKEIQNAANAYKKILGTSDPFKICEILGFKVCFIPLSSHLHGFTDVKQKIADSLTTHKSQLTTTNASIYISSALDSYSKKIVCAHELGHISLQSREELNLFESGSDTKSIKEYEANLFAIELLPQIYHNTSTSYQSLSKDELQAFMNKKISSITFSL